MNAQEAAEAIDGTIAFTSELFAAVKAGGGNDLKAIYDETMNRLRPKYGQCGVIFFESLQALQCDARSRRSRWPRHTRIWTAERDVEMWQALEKGTPMKSAEA